MVSNQQNTTIFEYHSFENIKDLHVDFRKKPMKLDFAEKQMITSSLAIHLKLRFCNRAYLSM